MTSTPCVSGFGDNTKPSSKVLRPPGGGSSDIFGSEGQTQTPRAVRNHMASNIFGSNDQNAVKNNGDSARRAQKNIDSYSRLFGEPERPMTPAKNFMKSSIPIGPNAGAAAGKQTNGSSSLSSSSASSSSGATSSAVAAAAAATNGHTSNSARNGNKYENGGDHQNGLSKTDGNPVTGEGYKPAGAEINTSVPALNGANQVIIKNRIPPGGYSSGLW